jgi:DNA-binding GntR family transcriptional regulator
MALRQSVARASNEWEENLVLSHHRMIRESQDNPEVFEQYHKAFHMALLANCDSPILLKFCSQLYDLNVRYRYLAAQSNNYQSRDVSDEHLSIMQAAVEKDADTASKRLLDHYRKTGVFLTVLFG